MTSAAAASAAAAGAGDSASEVNVVLYRVWSEGAGNGDSHGALHPPTLLRLTVTSSPVPAPFLQAESFSQSFSQHAATRPTPPIKVVLSASRMMNGQQQSASVDVPVSDVLSAGQRGSKNKKMQEHEAVRMLADAFQGTSQTKAGAAENGYKGEYDAHSRELEITFADFSGLSAILDFDGDKRHTKTASMTPAYGLAFEGACELDKQLHDARAQNNAMATQLRLKEQDLRTAERKIQNLQIELNSKRDQLSRLLSSGGSSLADLGRTGSSGVAARERRFELYGAGGGSQGGPRGRASSPATQEGGGGGRGQSQSPRKKAPKPSLARPGRTAARVPGTGFVDSASDSDAESAGDASTAAPTKGRGSTLRKSGRDAEPSRKKQKLTSPEPSDDSATSLKRGSPEDAAVEPKHISPSGNGKDVATTHAGAGSHKGSTPKLQQPLKAGRTLQKQVSTAFQDSDADDATDHSE